MTSHFFPDGTGRSSIADQLLARRVIVVSGPLDDGLCTDLMARLLSLDALGDEAISLRIAAAGGSLDGCLGTVDVIDALGVPVRAMAVGRVEGAPIAILAACEHRNCGPHATFVLRGEATSLSGSARQLGDFAAEQARRHYAMAEVVARRSVRDAEHVAADMENRLSLDAYAARAYGLVDEILDDDQREIRLPESWQRRGFGFRPPSEP